MGTSGCSRPGTTSGDARWPSRALSPPSAALPGAPRAANGELSDRSALSASFDCFNNDMGCGQTIVSTIQILLSIAGTLITATASCAPPASGPPFYFLKDRTIAGFNCYRKIWHVVQRLIKVAKYIDLTVNLCPGPDPAIAAAGLPLSAALEDAVDPLGANASNFTEPGAWDSLSRQQGFATAEDLMVTVAPVERRLDELKARLPDLGEQEEEGDEDIPEHVGPHNIRDIFGRLLTAMEEAFPAKLASVRGVPRESPLHV